MLITNDNHLFAALAEGDKAAAANKKHENDKAAAAKKPESNEEDKAGAFLQDAGLPSYYFTCFSLLLLILPLYLFRVQNFISSGLNKRHHSMHLYI